METTRKQKMSNLMVGLVILGMLLGTYILYMLTKQPEVFWDRIVYSGFIPRVISWMCLIGSVYGLARRRFSPLVVAMFMIISFFFAYIGYFLIPEIY